MIQSFLCLEASPDGGVVHLVFDTAFAGKHLLTACGQGRIAGDDAMLTATGEATLDALVRHLQNTKRGAVHLIEIATPAAAAVRVRKALEKAHEEDAVFFVCRSAHVYDAAIQTLNLQRPSRHET